MPETNKKAPAKKAAPKKTTTPKKKVVKEEEIKTEEKVEQVKEVEVKTPEVETPKQEEIAAASEVKEEEKVEPAKVEEVVVPTQVPSASNPVPLFRERIESFDKYAEEKRVPFYKEFFKIKLVSYILMGVILAVVIALFLCVFLLRSTSLNWIIYVLLVVCIVGLVGNMVYSKLTVKKSEKKFRDYVYTFLHELQEVCYQDTALKDATIDVQGKVENEKIYYAHVYSTINRIESRSVVKGTLYGHDFTSADVAITIPPTGEIQKTTKGKANEVFAVYGRAFEYDYKLAEGQGLIVVRKTENTIMPTHIIGYKEVSIPNFDENIVVYTTDDNLAYGFFTAALIERINKLLPNENLFDYIISLNDKGTFIYTNYNDNYMVVPTSKAHPENTYSQVVEDNRNILAILELLK